MLSLLRKLLHRCQQTCIITTGLCPALARHHFKTTTALANPQYLERFSADVALCILPSSRSQNQKVPKTSSMCRILHITMLSTQHFLVQNSGSQLSIIVFFFVMFSANTFSANTSSVSISNPRPKTFRWLHVHYSLSEKLPKGYLKTKDHA